MDKLCPLLNKACIEHQCKFFVHVLGKDPQNDQVIDHWDCTFAFLPKLMIENSNMQRQTGAAIESFRNVTVRALQSALNNVRGMPDQARHEKLVG